jgi:hypothetical protein
VLQELVNLTLSNLYKNKQEQERQKAMDCVIVLTVCQPA